MKSKRHTITKQRMEISQALLDGGELMLTYGANRKPRLSWKSGARINDDVAAEMLKGGMLVLIGNDGLFKGSAQTYGLSSNYRKQLEESKK